MKPHVLLLAVVASLPSAMHLSAQERFFIGATAGLSSTSLSGDIPESGSYTSRLGFSGGLIAEYALTDDIRLSVQPSFARRGTRVVFDVGTDEPRDSLNLTLDYGSIPVMARFLTPGGSWFVNGGLDLGFLLGASLEDRTTGGEADVETLINDTDLMMLFGVGGTIPLDPALFTIEVRYGQSLMNAGANDELAATLGFSPRFRSSGFQLLVAVLYPL
jgi:hypothetical protein